MCAREVEMPEKEAPAAVQEAAMMHQPHLWETGQASVGVMVMAFGTPAGLDDIEWYYIQMRGGRAPAPVLTPQYAHLNVGMYRGRLATADTASPPLSVSVCSVGFVSDYPDIMYDLDIEARQAAERLGLAFERTPVPNDDPNFLAALAPVIRRYVDAVDGGS
jgi:protoheme ferro-lyase